MHLPFRLPLLSPSPVFDEGIRLFGDRLVLRPLHTADAPAMYRFASDPWVTRYLPWEPARDVESVRAFLDEQVGKRKRGESLGMAVLLRENGAMIGSTDLMRLRSLPRGNAEVGYLLGRDYWGCGYMTEATRIIAGYALENLRLKRLVAFADHENYGSRRVLEKLGLRMCGTEERDIKGELRLYIRYAADRPTLERVLSHPYISAVTRPIAIPVVAGAYADGDEII